MTDDNRLRRLQHCCHLARFDSSRRSQHEGTTRQLRRQAAWRFAMELWAQRHLGSHSGRHSGKRLSVAECHHQCQCRWDCSCQKKNKYSSLSGTHDFFRVTLETLGPMSVSTQEFLAQIGRRLTEVTTDQVERRSFSSACRSPSNASTRHA